MPDMTTMERAELRTFGNSIESFVSDVSSHCTSMENGIAYCASYMKDVESQKALRDAADVCMNIRSTLSPAQMLLQKVLDLMCQFDNYYTR